MFILEALRIISFTSVSFDAPVAIIYGLPFEAICSIISCQVISPEPILNASKYGSTKSTINAIREGTYREAINEAKNPVEVGLCSYEDIQRALDKNTKKNK